MAVTLTTPKRSREPNGNEVFLHGELDIAIIEAKSLPNMDLASERMRKCLTMFTACGPNFDKKGHMHSIITSDPYVSVCLSGATVAKTRVISNSENPSWDEHFRVFVAHPVVKVEFQVKDNDVLGAQLIGIVEICAERIITGALINGWFPISGAYPETSPELHLSIQYIPVGDENSRIVNNSGETSGVPNTYFPLRKGGNLTLYQDAHVPDGMLPDIKLDNGEVFKHGKCWEDICHGIMEAHHLIYITGWSIFHKVKLVREPSGPLPSGGEFCLGDLLKYKSQEGVRVVLLIWDDKTSHDKFLLKTEGLMGTHDEETKRFFKHSSVRCVLCPRYASNKLSIFKQQVVGTIFSHHQKCVLLDTQATGNNRKITAFIGGLDLCDGRYDTPEHRLFSDLDTVFKDDYHNPTLLPTTSGPREPWHDLHCKIEGPAAYDIMINFEQRWKKAGKWLHVGGLKRVKSWNDDTLIKLERISWIITPSPGPDGELVAHVTDENDRESWNIQVFRSIDSGSVRGFPKDVKKAEALNLVCRKNLQIDKSIHTAYVKAIRSAQHFVYIENQYFLGSSYCWPSYKNAGADNLIPMELALKIASKIAANERFAVYIVIPMYPEGIPSSATMQEILFWQGQTMAMMYKIVGDALANAGLSDIYHPQDYLNFYCLGKREAFMAKPPKYSQSFENSAAGLAQRYGRFMIYVHSKGMIVDDEYVLIGSANINQRSLDGSRDTEIAMGAYQPNYTWAEKGNHPRGQVYGYRMSLWAEHLGQLEDTFQEPQTLACVRLVNKNAKKNWKAYVSDENMEMTGHLMKYPIQVSRSGNVGPVPGYETFPDVGGKVLGAPSSVPDALTT